MPHDELFIVSLSHKKPVDGKFGGGSTWFKARKWRTKTIIIEHERPRLKRRSVRYIFGRVQRGGLFIRVIGLVFGRSRVERSDFNVNEIYTLSFCLPGETTERVEIVVLVGLNNRARARQYFIRVYIYIYVMSYSYNWRRKLLGTTRTLYDPKSNKSLVRTSTVQLLSNVPARQENVP